MDRDTVFLRVVWPLLCIAMAAGAVLDFGTEVLAEHWHLPFAYLLATVVPYSLFAKVHGHASTRGGKTASLVCGALALGALTGASIALDFSQFQPTGWVALIFVAWTLPLMVFVLPVMAIDHFCARAEAIREDALQGSVEP